MRAGNLYEVKWENGAACYYLSLLFAGTWDWPDVFERSWCVNSDPLGNQLCVSNEINSSPPILRRSIVLGRTPKLPEPLL